MRRKSADLRLRLLALLLEWLLVLGGVIAVVYAVWQWSAPLALVLAGVTTICAGLVIGELL